MDPQACLEIVVDEAVERDVRRAAATAYNRWRSIGGACGKIDGRKVDAVLLKRLEGSPVIVWWDDSPSGAAEVVRGTTQDPGS